MKTILKSILFLAIASAANAKENLSADAQAVDAACSQDAATAGCGTEKVGTGLLKCLAAYKKSHKEFKFSEGCKTAKQTMKNDRKSNVARPNNIK